MDDGSEDKKAKGTKKRVKKENLNLFITKYIIYKKNEINIVNLKKDHKEYIKNNKWILKTQGRFKSERHGVFTEEINKIALSSNDDKRIQSINSIETYAYVTGKDLVSEKEEIKCINIIKLLQND